MKKVYLGLGSNTGDRAELIVTALRHLARPDFPLLRVSSLYETEPIGFPDQPWFLNAVAEFNTTLFPLQLLQHIHRVERKMGRVRTIRNGPRNIDIDILYYSRAIVTTPKLEIPHPRLRERRFVLAPLAELNPSLRDPVSGQTVARMLAGLRGQAVRIAGALPTPLPGSGKTEEIKARI